jgi:hypothetical protein
VDEQQGKHEQRDRQNGFHYSADHALDTFLLPAAVGTLSEPTTSSGCRRSPAFGFLVAIVQPATRRTGRGTDRSAGHWPTGRQSTDQCSGGGTDRRPRQRALFA